MTGVALIHPASHASGAPSEAGIVVPLIGNTWFNVEKARDHLTESVATEIGKQLLPGGNFEGQVLSSDREISISYGSPAQAYLRIRHNYVACISQSDLTKSELIQILFGPNVKVLGKSYRKTFDGELLTSQFFTVDARHFWMRQLSDQHRMYIPNLDYGTLEQHRHYMIETRVPTAYDFQIDTSNNEMLFQSITTEMIHEDGTCMLSRKRYKLYFQPSEGLMEQLFKSLPERAVGIISGYLASRQVTPGMIEAASNQRNRPRIFAVEVVETSAD
jgi:hypothetical protein